MKTLPNLSLLASSVFLGIGALAAPAGEEPRFFAEEGRTLQKSFVQHSETKLVEAKLVIETPDGPQEPEAGEPDLTIVDDETIEFSDEFVKLGKRGPTKLKRTFSSIENTQKFNTEAEGAEDGTIENESGLDGKSVMFAWDEDADAFAATWFECEGDDKLLGDLVQDADFRLWLGEEERKIAEGDTWEIPAAEYNNLQEPSGPMGYQPADSEEEEDDDPSAKALRENIKGEIKATYKGTREEDGVLVGVIAFEGKVESRAESEIEQEEGPAIEHAIEIGAEFEGELLWDWAGGHFRKLSCDAEQKLVITDKQQMEIQGGSIGISQTQSFEGKKTYRFSCAPKQG